jgi:hypothetical protein
VHRCSAFFLDVTSVVKIDTPPSKPGYIRLSYLMRLICCLLLFFQNKNKQKIKQKTKPGWVPVFTGSGAIIENNVQLPSHRSLQIPRHHAFLGV